MERTTKNTKIAKFYFLCSLRSLRLILLTLLPSRLCVTRREESTANIHKWQPESRNQLRSSY